MKTITAKSKPLQIVVGIFVVYAIIVIGKTGYYFGVWLKDALN